MRKARASIKEDDKA